MVNLFISLPVNIDLFKKIYLVKGSIDEKSKIELLSEKKREYSIMKKGRQDKAYRYTGNRTDK